jgi:DNA-binding SARP family transcriptional activator
VNFLILGALEVWHDGRPVPITSLRLRALLAGLLLNANRFVTVDNLLEYIWDNAPPSRSRATLHTYVYRLRGLLKVLPHVDLQTDAAGSGYILGVNSGSIDANVFNDSITEAHEYLDCEDLLHAAMRLRAALSMWRGRTLANVNTERVQQEAQFLDNERLTIHEELLSIEFALGNHRQVIPELGRLVVAHPYRETLAAQLMLALYRSGDQVEALNVYNRTRHRLHEELGLEPGQELQALQLAILKRTSPDALTDPRK